MTRRVIKQFQSQGCSQSRRFLNVRVDTSFDRVKASSDNLIDFPHLQFERLCCFFCNRLEDCPYISCCGDFSEVYIKLSRFSLQGSMLLQAIYPGPYFTICLFLCHFPIFCSSTFLQFRNQFFRWIEDAIGLLVTDIAAWRGAEMLQRTALAEIMPALGDNWVLEGLATDETLEW